MMLVFLSTFAFDDFDLIFQYFFIAIAKIKLNINSFDYIHYFAILLGKNNVSDDFTIIINLFYFNSFCCLVYCKMIFFL